MDERRVGEQRLGARPAATGSVAAIVEGDHVGLRVEAVEVGGDMVGVPGIAAEAQDDEPVSFARPRGRNVETVDAFAVRHRQSKMPGAGGERPGRSGEAGQIGRASCGERVCQYGLISGGALSLKKKTKNKKNN